MLLTYREIAEKQGISVASARQLVRRKGWRKVEGNDATLRVEIPDDLLSSEPPAPKIDPKDLRIVALEAENQGLRQLLDEVRAGRVAADEARATAEERLLIAVSEGTQATTQLEARAEIVAELRAQLAASQEREGGTLARLLRDLIRRR